MFRHLSSSHDNCQIIVIPLTYETRSVICHRLMTTVRAWECIPQVRNMLRQLSSSQDNGQSTVIYACGKKHALLVVIVSRQRTEHGY